MIDKQQLEEQGFVQTGDIGGQPKHVYWTPDGRKIMAMLDLHEYIKRGKTDNVIEQGVRDANLDKGWLTTKPDNLKPYCPHCDKWHDTEVDVIKCGEKKIIFITEWERKAQKELAKSGDNRIDKLEGELSEIKDMLRKLLEK